MSYFKDSIFAEYNDKYVGTPEDEKKYVMMRERNKYTTKVNNWLNEPLILNNKFQYEDSNGNEIFPDLEIDEYDEIDHSNFTHNYDVHVKRNSSVCLYIYKELVQLIQESGYILSDEKQFKEDFIHYMYSISS